MIRIIVTVNKDTKINIRLPKSLYEKYKAEAAKLELPISAYIRMCLIQTANGFDKEEK